MAMYGYIKVSIFQENLKSSLDSYARRWLDRGNTKKEDAVEKISQQVR